MSRSIPTGGRRSKSLAPQTIGDVPWILEQVHAAAEHGPSADGGRARRDAHVVVGKRNESRTPPELRERDTLTRFVDGDCTRTIRIVEDGLSGLEAPPPPARQASGREGESGRLQRIEEAQHRCKATQMTDRLTVSDTAFAMTMRMSLVARMRLLTARPLASKGR
jgi:hypothetical protein